MFKRDGIADGDGLAAATPRRLVGVRPEEADQLGAHDLRHLFVRVVAHTGDQEDFGVGEYVNRMPCVFRKVGSIDLSAEDQRLRLDVGPIVRGSQLRPTDILCF